MFLNISYQISENFQLSRTGNGTSTVFLSPPPVNAEFVGLIVEHHRLHRDKREYLGHNGIIESIYRTFRDM